MHKWSLDKSPAKRTYALHMAQELTYMSSAWSILPISSLQIFHLVHASLFPFRTLLFIEPIYTMAFIFRKCNIFLIKLEYYMGCLLVSLFHKEAFYGEICKLTDSSVGDKPSLLGETHLKILLKYSQGSCKGTHQMLVEPMHLISSHWSSECSYDIVLVVVFKIELF